jgi:hypothetical protein
MKKLKWIKGEKDYTETWRAKSFLIERIEGDEEPDGFLLYYSKRQIEYFSTLKKAQKVATLIHNAQ